LSRKLCIRKNGEPVANGIRGESRTERKSIWSVTARLEIQKDRREKRGQSKRCSGGLKEKKESKSLFRKTEFTVFIRKGSEE